MIRRLIPLVLGAAVTIGLVTPVAAEAQTSTVARQAATIEAKYPGIHFASAADAVRYGQDLAVLNPNGVPPPDPNQEYTVAQYKAVLIGRRIGPSANTYNGEFTITGWTASGNKWLRTRSATSCPVCETIGVDGVNRTGVTPNGLPSWADPTKWNWHAILGSVMDDIWNGCAKGSLTGVVSTAGATVAANLVARAAPVFLGPWGYAAIAISACVVGIINK